MLLSVRVYVNTAIHIGVSIRTGTARHKPKVPGGPDARAWGRRAGAAVVGYWGGKSRAPFFVQVGVGRTGVSRRPSPGKWPHYAYEMVLGEPFASV